MGVKVGVFVGTGDGVKVEVEIVVSVGTTLAAGAHEARIKATRKTVTMFLIFIDYLILQGTAQRCALPAGGRDETMPFARTSLQPEICSKNAATPTRRVHALC